MEAGSPSKIERDVAEASATAKALHSDFERVRNAVLHLQGHEHARQVDDAAKFGFVTGVITGASLAYLVYLVVRIVTDK